LRTWVIAGNYLRLSELEFSLETAVGKKMDFTGILSSAQYNAQYTGLNGRQWAVNGTLSFRE